MSRKGKIAQLPLTIPNEITRRRQNGEPGQQIAGWALRCGAATIKRVQ
jgi:hypothetical protein